MALGVPYGDLKKVFERLQTDSVFTSILKLYMAGITSDNRIPMSFALTAILVLMRLKMPSHDRGAKPARPLEVAATPREAIMICFM